MRPVYRSRPRRSYLPSSSVSGLSRLPVTPPTMASVVIWVRYFHLDCTARRSGSNGCLCTGAASHRCRADRGRCGCAAAARAGCGGLCCSCSAPPRAPSTAISSNGPACPERRRRGSAPACGRRSRLNHGCSGQLGGPGWVSSQSGRSRSGNSAITSMLFRWSTSPPRSAHDDAVA
ncbi:hypothetical protein E1211_16270 [Micromonospora sp. 15K316]|nr:hypothetical protein E1211_16270 [Micromonospora sp. 15K316]